MWAVYLCGCTDCFMHAMFIDFEEAFDYGTSKSINPEGWSMKYIATPEDIDRSDTGWDSFDKDAIGISISDWR